MESCRVKLAAAHLTNFKPIEDSGLVPIDESITVLVGQDESGKTAFTQALHKARSVHGDDRYNYIEEYPRRHLDRYDSQHRTHSAVIARLK
jgi:predicted ATP-binding protein involved in virulence